MLQVYEVLSTIYTHLKGPITIQNSITVKEKRAEKAIHLKINQSQLTNSRPGRSFSVVERKTQPWCSEIYDLTSMCRK
jgi:hypothetical protein